MKRKKDIRRRLLDTMRELPILAPLPNEDVVLDPYNVIAHHMAIAPFLETAQCIEASNIARYFEQTYAQTPEQFAGFQRDLKCLVPPFRSFFIEWEKPYGIPIGQRMGMLFLACPAELADATIREILGENAHTTPKMIAEYRTKYSPKWIYLTFDFVEFSNSDRNHISGLRGPYHVGVMAVAEDGALLDWWMSHASSAISREASMQLGLASLVAWTALAMLNCQNIDTIEHHAPEPFQRSRTRKGKKPLISYRTIQVNLERTPRSIGAECLPDVDADGNVRLHGVRGHMKDYRKGKGLFGKYKGLWYWGPALAGDASEGVVVSDYKVNAPTEKTS